MKKTAYFLLLLFTMGTAVTSFTSCRENKSTSEKVEDGLEDAGDAIEDGAEDAGDAIEDAVD